MNRKPLLYVFFLLLMPCCLQAQQKALWRVYDAITKEAIPFATVKFGNSSRGMVASLEGKFELPGEIIPYIEVSSLGYKAKKITLPENTFDIYLLQEDNTLKEVVIKPPYEKMRRILNSAIANKNRNNPDKYDWYRCHVYYKMVVDASYPDSILPKDTSKDNREIQEFLTSQHLLMSETYSIRTWHKPQHLQEDVLASRFSGLKKSVFTSLVTDVLPFHAYNDYITMNGKDYHNPVSKGFEQHYKFNLDHEIIQGDDTVWVLSFRPRKNKANDLKGTVYINSSGYAISQIVAKGYDTMLRMNVRIEQQYEQLRYNDSEKRWFPKHLNYIIDWQQKSHKTYITLHMKGNSRIDSVDWKEDENFRFDKTHTVRRAANADELSDTAWQATRPERLDAKEARTYKVIDSLGDKLHFDRYMYLLSKLPDGKVPVSIFDIAVNRLFSYNYYENVRLGLGLQTNEKLVKWLSVGGWGGYGFLDQQWKYGAFAEVYADKYKEFVFRVGYADDISDPGRVSLHRDLDKSYLKSYLLQRVDETKTLSASVKKKIDYWSVELAARQQEIIPKYHYALLHEGIDLSTFTAHEASLSFRYAYAERRAPIFDYYYSLGSRYPIWYGKITSGAIESGNMLTSYTQITSAAVWHKHINRLGNEHFVIEGGKSWSADPLPLGKLFAGNGFKYDTKSSKNESIYTFGGMMTIYPYEFYTDQFVNFIFRHDFDWKLYKLEIPKTAFSSLPYICLQYNLLCGSLDHPEVQKYVAFSVPYKVYNETGLILNNLVRLRYANLYYITVNAGYFWHVSPTFDAKHNGRIVYGVGVEL